MKDLEKLRSLILDEKTATAFYGRFTAEPFERGYGHTIGNSLRRILLSSLPGAAITAVKITGALHEFAVLKGVKEDVARIILNLKKIRVKLHSDGPEKLYLKVQKAGAVTAGDIEKNSSVEIMNPEQEIANIDSGVVLEMEIEISSGVGYELADENKASKYPIGTILLDALFSPVKKVNYEVENTRVGQTLNYDKLVIEIWTDGSISPSDALRDSANILKESLNIFTQDNVNDSSDTDEDKTDNEKKAGGKEDEPSSVLNQSLSVLDLSTRAANALKKAGIKTIEQLVKITEEDMNGFKNFGDKSIEEIKDKLAELGLSLAEQKGNGGK
ncbi:MAG: DNA-directed RNA polymerase subunit alpha [Elusimicrobiota bacterium]|jgi:DNA-directed RNA polymerase subunit alpha|nr:DNA-directed RNA polymerase subunit alpha [Elusimicrobiota bacterium]